jgi:hypothetical protein
VGVTVPVGVTPIRVDTLVADWMAIDGALGACASSMVVTPVLTGKNVVLIAPSRNARMRI